MPVITAGVAGNTNASGLSATVAHVLEADLSDDVAVYGLPATVLTPPPTPQTTPDAVRAKVLDSAGNFICNLPHAQGLRAFGKRFDEPIVDALCDDDPR